MNIRSFDGVTILSTPYFVRRFPLFKTKFPFAMASFVYSSIPRDFISDLFFFAILPFAIISPYLVGYTRFYLLSNCLVNGRSLSQTLKLWCAFDLILIDDLFDYEQCGQSNFHFFFFFSFYFLYIQKMEINGLMSISILLLRNGDTKNRKRVSIKKNIFILIVNSKIFSNR